MAFACSFEDIPMPVSIFRTRKNVNEANAVFAIKSFYLVFRIRINFVVNNQTRVIIMSKKNQLTLAAFGYTKSAVHRGKETVVDIPLAVPDEYIKLKCEFCKQQFANQQGLSVHLL